MTENAVLCDRLPESDTEYDGRPSLVTFLMEVWQEACRHIEIGESTATIAKILAQHMPVAQIIVRRIDSQRSVLETVTCTLQLVRTPCPPRELPARQVR